MMRPIAALLLLAAPPTLAQERPSRAEQNHAAVMAGTIAWTSLSASERAEVAGIARIRRQGLTYARCRQIELAGRAGTHLDEAMLALKCGRSQAR